MSQSRKRRKKKAAEIIERRCDHSGSSNEVELDVKRSTAAGRCASKKPRPPPPDRKQSIRPGKQKEEEDDRGGAESAPSSNCFTRCLLPGARSFAFGGGTVVAERTHTLLVLGADSNWTSRR